MLAAVPTVTARLMSARWTRTVAIVIGIPFASMILLLDSAPTGLRMHFTCFFFFARKLLCSTLVVIIL